MFPETEKGSRPSGLCRVLLLRVVEQDILGRAAEQRSSGAAGQRSSGAAEQRSSGETLCVGQRDEAML